MGIEILFVLKTNSSFSSTEYILCVCCTSNVHDNKETPFIESNEIFETLILQINKK